ncbi:hypothetical protein Tco_0246951 [Tanacetum coccineum]
MASMNTRLNIEKLDENIVQKHGGSKQVGLKQLGSKQVGFKQLGQKQVGFKQLGPGTNTPTPARSSAKGIMKLEVYTRLVTMMLAEWQQRTGSWKDKQT